MAKDIYVGVDGVARRAKALYVGVDSVARRVSKVYVGVDGVARLAWDGNTKIEPFSCIIGVTYPMSQTGSGPIPSIQVTAQLSFGSVGVSDTSSVIAPQNAGKATKASITGVPDAVRAKYSCVKLENRHGVTCSLLLNSSTGEYIGTGEDIPVFFGMNTETTFTAVLEN